MTKLVLLDVPCISVVSSDHRVQETDTFFKNPIQKIIIF